VLVRRTKYKEFDRLSPLAVIERLGKGPQGNLGSVGRARTAWIYFILCVPAGGFLLNRRRAGLGFLGLVGEEGNLVPWGPVNRPNQKRREKKPFSFHTCFSMRSRGMGAGVGTAPIHPAKSGDPINRERMNK